MGKIGEKTYGGANEMLLDRNYFTKPYKFLQSAAYVSTDTEGRKYVKMGTVVPANDATAVGLALKDYYVDGDDFNGAVVYAGHIKAYRLPQVLDADAIAALPRLTFD